MKNKMKIMSKDEQKCLWGILDNSPSNVILFIKIQQCNINGRKTDTSKVQAKACSIKWSKLTSLLRVLLLALTKW